MSTKRFGAAGRRWAGHLMLVIVFILLTLALAGCGSRDTLRVVAGSGFSSFEPILKRWGDQNGVDVQVTYKGSLDIMLMLEDGSIGYDAISARRERRVVTALACPPAARRGPSLALRPGPRAAPGGGSANALPGPYEKGGVRDLG